MDHAKSQDDFELEDEPSIGYICPLYKELRAVRASFDEELGRVQEDTVDFYYGRIGGRKAVAVHFGHEEIGPLVAQQYAAILLNRHESLEDPESICLLIGIAGGVWTNHDDVRLGDVVIATKIWDWRSGKLTQHGLEPTQYPQNANNRLLRVLPEFLDDRESLESAIEQYVHAMRARDQAMDWRWTHQGNIRDKLYKAEYLHSSGNTCGACDPLQLEERPVRTLSRPCVHDGILASGNIVLKDAVSREQLQQKKVLAVDMEACGVPPRFITIRGISDYSDSHKNDDWQAYAAAVAAACARCLVEFLSLRRPKGILYLPKTSKRPRRTTDHTLLEPRSRSDELILDGISVRNSKATDERKTVVISTYDFWPHRPGSNFVDPRPSSEERSARKGWQKTILTHTDGPIESVKLSVSDLSERYGSAGKHYKYCWEKPVVKLTVQTDRLNHGPLCYLTITPEFHRDTPTLHVWLPIHAVSISAKRGNISIVYNTFIDFENIRLPPALVNPESAFKVQLEMHSANNERIIFTDLLTQIYEEFYIKLTYHPRIHGISMFRGEMAISGEEKSSVLHVRQEIEPQKECFALMKFSDYIDLTSLHSTETAQITSSSNTEALLHSMKLGTMNMAALVFNLSHIILTEQNLRGWGETIENVSWSQIPQTLWIFPIDRSINKVLQFILDPNSHWSILGVFSHQVEINMKYSGLDGRSSKFLPLLIILWQQEDIVRCVAQLPAPVTDSSSTIWESWDIHAGRGELSYLRDGGCITAYFEPRKGTKRGDRIKLIARKSGPYSWTIGNATPQSLDAITLKFSDPAEMRRFSECIEPRFLLNSYGINASDARDQFEDISLLAGTIIA